MRYAVLSDIHANADALRVALDAIPSDMPIWFLGDAVGYHPDFQEVLQILLDLQRAGRLQAWLKGNHDDAIASPAGDMNDLARATIDLTRQGLSPAEQQLLADLDELVILDDLQITLVHGRPGNRRDQIGGYLYKSEARTANRHLTTPLCIAGHTHDPRKIAWNGRQWYEQIPGHVADNTFTLDDPTVFLNPGSVGQPRCGHRIDREGWGHAAFGILDLAASSFVIHRLPYDVRPLQQRTIEWLAQSPLQAGQVEKLVQRLVLAF